MGQKISNCKCARVHASQDNSLPKITQLSVTDNFLFGNVWVGWRINLKALDLSLLDPYEAKRILHCFYYSRSRRCLSQV